MNFKRLLFGTNELYLSEEWLRSSQMRQYEQWTLRQLDQGSVVSSADPVKARHAEFWKHVTEKLQTSNVTPMRKRQHGS